jgi:heme/copper-type cytochrome/quinol oxidase subunit 2
MVGMIIVCFFVLYFFIYFACKVSERFCSDLWVFEWLKEKELKGFLEIAPWAMLIVISAIAVTGEGALKVSKEYAWQNVQARASAENRLKESEMEIMALKDEKRFAFQPAPALVVKAEAQESSEDKKEESQSEIVLAVEKMEQAENVSNSVKTDEVSESDFAKLRAQIDALNLRIMAVKAQISAQITPVPAEAGISEVVATMN